MSRRAIALLMFLTACRSTLSTVPLPSLDELPPNILPKDAVRANGAVRYLEVVVGSGAVAEERKCVFTHYMGYLTDGSRFESSRDTAGAKEAIAIAWVIGGGQVIKGWELGVQGMRVGGTRRLFIPTRLAYGARGSPPAVPRNADLIFDVELIEVAKSTTTRQGKLICDP